MDKKTTKANKQPSGFKPAQNGPVKSSSKGSAKPMKDCGCGGHGRK